MHKEKHPVERENLVTEKYKIHIAYNVLSRSLLIKYQLLKVRDTSKLELSLIER